MDFLKFCSLHGLIVHSYPPIGVWKRYPTEDHPKKRNGAAKYMGDHGFVQNHATETEVSLWQPDKDHKIDLTLVRKASADAAQKIMHEQKVAAARAAFILKECQSGKHEYLKAKGFPDEQGHVWTQEGKHFLVIPMRVGFNLVGCQLIDSDGGKKFLYGQRSSGASFVFDNKGVNILCEGYATALSVRLALKNMKRRYTLHVCFSDSNLIKIASGLESGFVVADNDPKGAGERAAIKTGFDYWMSDLVGEDFNDYSKRVGQFRSASSLVKSMNAAGHKG